MAHSLTFLAVFQNIMHKEMMRSLHVYGSVGIGREFSFESTGPYVEKIEKPFFLSENLRLSSEQISEGSVFGTWRCIFLFKFDHSLPRFPTFLCPSRNPKLEDIPNLANELKFISELKAKKPEKFDLEQCSRVGCFVHSEQIKFVSEEDSVEDCEVDQPKQQKFVFKQDLNCLPDSESETEESENDKTEESKLDARIVMSIKRRASLEMVSGFSLQDLSKYFGLTMVEASQNLNVGLTFLKKKCRQFGISRWPYRKIKSLNILNQDLQREEAEKKQEKNEAAAMKLAMRQAKVEIEKENIVKRPFMEMQMDTKIIRQNNFKRRCVAKKKCEESLATSSSSI